MIETEPNRRIFRAAVCLNRGRILAKVVLMISMTLALRGWAAAPDALAESTLASSESVQAGVDGVASYYGKDHHGKKPANGEYFDMYKLTAAHRSLPFGTKVRVTNLSNNRSVIVRINDRGPYITGRTIDLSQAAAERLGMIRVGVVKVKMEILDHAILPAKESARS